MICQFIYFPIEDKHARNVKDGYQNKIDTLT